MLEQHKLHSPEAALEFILGGKAIVTARASASGKHYTYRVRQGDGGIWFVGLLTGDNEFGYTYIGQLRAWPGQSLSYSHGQRSSIAADSQPGRAAKWVFGALAAGALPHGVELFHEGKCRACGRKLTTPGSLAAGIGPECQGRGRALKPKAISNA